MDYGHFSCFNSRNCPFAEVITRVERQQWFLLMSITTTGNLGPMILQSLAPAMLYTPTPQMNYILVCDKVSMPVNGGTTCRFMRPRALQPPTIQLGNSGIDPPAQVPQRDIIDAQMAFFGLSNCAEVTCNYTARQAA